MRMPIYHVDAITASDKGETLREFHLETPFRGEAEGAFLRCWFKGEFWDVRIRKTWKDVQKEKGWKSEYI